MTHNCLLNFLLSYPAFITWVISESNKSINIAFFNISLFSRDTYQNIKICKACVFYVCFFKSYKTFFHTICKYTHYT